MKNEEKSVTAKYSTQSIELLPDGSYERSLYDDELTQECMIEMFKYLKIAFPEQPAQFFDMLSERILANNFTDKRLQDAVCHVIDNVRYNCFKVADIVSFDKRERLITYNDLLKKVMKGSATFDDYEIVRLPNINLWRAKR